ncbi:MAG: TonB-dependent receptor [Hyphomonadaceae bacterium JAD_PAG50586_4]|nr:MAG: TonB-dependent receptor [Hyphomonadaceae bacterium JAD_PAG50586_4]
MPRRDLARLAYAGAAGAALFCGGVASAQTQPAEEEEIVVTATRSEQALIDVPASIAAQDVDVLRQRGFTYGTDEFRGVTGVFFRRGEGDGDEFAFVSIRGSSGTEGYLTMVDGVPFFGTDEEPWLTQLPYDALERVEIVKGPVSALYGRGGIYGAVNYITRTPRENQTIASATFGSDDYFRGEALLERADGENGFLLSASYEDYAGWRDNSGKEVFNLLARADIELSDDLRLDLMVNYLDRYSEVPNAIPTSPDGEVVDVFGGREAFLGFGHPDNDLQGLIGGARLSWEARENLEFQFTAHARHFEQDLRLNFYDPFGRDLANNLIGFNGFYAQTTQDVYFGEASATYRSGAHALVAGVSYELMESESTDSWSGQNGFTFACGFNFYLVSVDVTTGQVVNADHPCFVVDEPLTRDAFTSNFWGAFVQDEITLSPNWRLTLGVRYDSFQREARVASPDCARSVSRRRGGCNLAESRAFLSL